MLKKQFILILIIVGVILPAEICFTIDNSKIQRIVDAMEGLYEIPLINTGTEEDPVWEPEFTPNQWAKECIRRWIVKQDKRWRHRQAIDTIQIMQDDTLVE